MIDKELMLFSARTKHKVDITNEVVRKTLG